MSREIRLSDKIWGRKLPLILAFLAGCFLGSCSVLPGRGDLHHESRDWRPVVGKKYERDGKLSRIVVEVWAYGVRWKHPETEKSYQCNFETWKRWAKQE